jgi:hypothetical protein
MVHSSNAVRELERAIGKKEFNEGHPFVLVQGSPDWRQTCQCLHWGLKLSLAKCLHKGIAPRQSTAQIIFDAARGGGKAEQSMVS